MGHEVLFFGPSPPLKRFPDLMCSWRFLLVDCSYALLGSGPLAI